MSTPIPTHRRSYVLPIIVMFFLFAMISFVTGFQNPFGVILKEQLSLNNFQSQLGNLANFIAYAFMGLPAGLLLQKKGYKFSAVMAVLVGLVGVCMMFISSLFDDKGTIFTVYLVGAFVAGFSMCMLNTVVNPMLNTLGGGGKRGNQLIQFGGSCNSLAATICPVLVGYLLGSSMVGKTLVDAWPALFIAMGIFGLALVVLLATKLPEPQLEERKIEGPVKDNPTRRKAFRFPNYVLGVIAIFLYVGVEVGIPNFANLYMTAPTMEQAQGRVAEYNHQQQDQEYKATLKDDQIIDEDDFGISQQIVKGELYSGLGMAAGTAGTLVGMYWFLMLVGRLIGGIVGGKVSPKTMLAVVSSFVIIMLLCALCFDGTVQIRVPGIDTTSMSFAMVPVSITMLFIVLCGLGTSVMWGAVFNLATEGLGKYTAVASGFFMVMVCGGGILPLVQGVIADWSGYLASYWIPIVAVVYLLFYALVGSRVTRRDVVADEIEKADGMDI